jgi:hypothetical protein
MSKVYMQNSSAVSTSFKIAPVNLEMNFSAEKLEEDKDRMDSPDSPFASKKGINDTPHKNCKGKVPLRTSCARIILLLMLG